MTYNFDVRPSEIKDLASAIADFFGKVRTSGDKANEFRIGDYYLDSTACLFVPDTTDIKTMDRLIDHLSFLGFEGYFEDGDEDEEDEGKPNMVIIELPIDKVFLPELGRIIATEEKAIKAELGIEETIFMIVEDRVAFPWFTFNTKPETIKRGMEIITDICARSLSAGPRGNTWKR